MHASRLLLPLFLMLAPVTATTLAQSDTATAPAPAATSPRDGQHDFDWEIGTWKTRLKRRLHPLAGSNEWVEYSGTTTVRKVWDGAANMVELDVKGPSGHIEGLSLRLYNAEAHQWSLNFANRATGTLVTPAIGEFNDGRGEFYNADMLNGRAILVRFVMSDITRDSAHFEQSFSADGGKTWESNWITVDTRLKQPLPLPLPSPERSGILCPLRRFSFRFGLDSSSLLRLRRPCGRHLDSTWNPAHRPAHGAAYRKR